MITNKREYFFNGKTLPDIKIEEHETLGGERYYRIMITNQTKITKKDFKDIVKFLEKEGYFDE